MNDTATDPSAADDLAYIRRVMEQTRRSVALHGDGFIVWGCLVFAGLLGNLIFHFIRPPGWAWLVLWAAVFVAGWIATPLLVRRRRRKAAASGHAGKLLGHIWLACSIAMIIMVFAGMPSGMIAPAGISGVISAIVGTGVLLTGTIMGSSWVRWVALGWWLAAIAQFFLPSLWPMLVMMLAIVVLMVVPGCILNRQANRLANATHD